MDLYETLEITSNASSRDIKKAYRRLAMKWHPDKNSAPEATQKFKEISDAYQILIDPVKRQDYDRTRQYTQHPQHPRHPQHTQHPRFFSYDEFYARYAETLRNPYDVFRDVMTIIDSINNAFNIVDNFFNSNINYLNNIEISRAVSFQSVDRGYRFHVTVHPNGVEQGVMDPHDLNKLIEYSYMH